MSSTDSIGPIQIIINASPETLYNYLVDFRNHVAWNHQLVEITQTTPDPIQVGTIFEAVEQVPASVPNWLEPIIMFLLRILASNPESRAEITHLVPNEQIEWMAQSPIKGKPDMQVKWQLTFTAQGEATQVSQQFQMFPHGKIARMMTNDKLKKQIAAGCKENLGKLNKLIENS
jgi:uncharacterized protein YndB with AHSA1/START domain